jgi:Spy/CpxP family protein refolding chaperone
LPETKGSILGNIRGLKNFLKALTHSKGMKIMKLKTTLALLAASFALASPFAVQAQTDQQMDAKFNQVYYMKMANKDGMVAKKDVMKMIEAKIDKMAKNGMISVADMGRLFSDLYKGQ